MTAIRLATMTGLALAPALPTLARLRIGVFRAYPYLYVGDEADEDRHLAAFARSEGAAIVMASDGETAVGCSTCVPARDEHVLHGPLGARGVDVASVCYFGESVLLPEYRGQGLGVAFFERREAHARSLGAELACFAAVRRPPDHPRRPAGYVPLDDFWRKRGFAPWPGPPLSFTWTEIGSAAPVENALDFWVKRL